MRFSGLFMASTAALGLGLAGAAFAQEQTVDDYVRALVADYADADDLLVDAIQLAELEPDDSTEVIFEIDPEKSYYVFGACDDDCADIDLEAHDQGEDLVDSDEEPDPNPMLLILPGESGDELHIVISLNDCDAETCVVGFGLYEAE